MEQTSEPSRPDGNETTAELSLREAAQSFELSVRTLGNQVRLGDIPAHKRRGPWGDEWRVTAQALEAFGYQRRAPVSRPREVSEHRVVELERQLDAARRAAAAERRRADEADRRLAEALDEVHRLRGVLAATGL